MKKRDVSIQEEDKTAECYHNTYRTGRDAAKILSQDDTGGRREQSSSELHDGWWTVYDE